MRVLILAGSEKEKTGSFHCYLTTSLRISSYDCRHIEFSLFSSEYDVPLKIVGGLERSPISGNGNLELGEKKAF